MRRDRVPLVVATLLLSACAVAPSRLTSTRWEGVETGSSRWSDVPVEPARDVDFEDYAAGRVDERSRGRGEGVLVLRAFDGATGSFVATPARLWRLDVPADATWERGDHLQRNLELSAGASRVEGLPAGRYRLQVDRQRVGSPDPPEFSVADGTEMRVQFLVRPPRKFHVRVVVVDEDGRSLDHGRVAVGTVSSQCATGCAPPWAHPRKRADGAETGHGSQLLACGRGVFRESRDGLRRTDVVADERGFDLGEFEERSRASSSWYEGLVEIDGRADAVVSIRSDLGVDTTFYGLAAPVDRVFAGVRKPDGSPVDLTKASHVSASCSACPASLAVRDGWWRDLLVDGIVELPGFEPLVNFPWRITTADERFVLTPLKK